MSRPKGSKNKPKVTLNMDNSNNIKSANIRLDLKKVIDGTPINRLNPHGWYNHGKRNDYPYRIMDLLATSPTFSACVNFAVKSICGNGIDYDTMGEDVSRMANYNCSWDEFIEAIANDYVVFGSFAFQIIKNNDNRTYSFFHTPYANIRFAKPNEEGIIDTVYICSDWTEYSTKKPIPLKRFNFTDDETIKRGEAQIFVYERYNPLNDIYATPSWIAATKPIMSEAEYCNYDLKSSTNSFTASGVLTFPSTSSEEEKTLIIQQVTSMFQGSENASTVMINFADNPDTAGIKFDKIDSLSDADAFKGANDRVVQRIVSAFNIPSKDLIGINTTGASLGGDANKLAVAYKLYEALVGNKSRETIVTAINNAFKLNGIEVELSIKPLDFSVNSNNTNTSDNVANENDKNQNKNSNINEDETVNK
nr:MAG: portal protein [Bacteriophage sp.]